MKKIAILLSLLLWQMLISSFVFAENNDLINSLKDYNIIDYAYCETNPLNRRTCLKMIMRALGVQQTKSINIQVRSEIVDSGKLHPFADLNHRVGGTLSEQKNAFHQDNGFFEIAYFNKLIYGTSIQNGKPVAAPTENATIGEAAAIMLRCLGYEPQTPEKSFETAAEIGLIPQTNLQHSDLLYPSVMYQILDCFLDQPRYLYQFEWESAEQDVQRSRTYRETLEIAEEQPLRRPYDADDPTLFNEHGELLTEESQSCIENYYQIHHITPYQSACIRYTEAAKNAFYDAFGDYDYKFQITTTDFSDNPFGVPWDSDVYNSYCHDVNISTDPDYIYWTITTAEKNGFIFQALVRCDCKIMSISKTAV